MARNNCGFRPYSGRNPSFGLNGRRTNLLVRTGGLVQDLNAGTPINVCNPQVTVNNGNGQGGGGPNEQQQVKCYNIVAFTQVNYKIGFDGGGNAAFDTSSAPHFSGAPWTLQQMVAALNDPGYQGSYAGGAYVGIQFAVLPNGQGIYVVQNSTANTYPSALVFEGNGPAIPVAVSDCTL